MVAKRTISKSDCLLLKVMEAEEKIKHYEKKLEKWKSRLRKRKKELQTYSHNYKCTYGG